MKIGIWGTGARTDRYIKYRYFEGKEICFFVDSYKKGIYQGVEIIAPSGLTTKMKEIEYLIISTQYCGEIIGMLWDLGIDRNRVIFTEFIDEKFYPQDMKSIKKLFPKLCDDIRMRRIHLMCENERDDFDNSKIIGTEQYNKVEYQMDYFRYRTFEFVGDEIIRNKVKGDIAELGVFRGLFASLISSKFQDKEIYLFDTFEGFDKNEAEREKKMGRSTDEFEYTHTLTNEETMIASMPFKDRIHICKGVFPNSVTDEIRSLNFSFVSIDVDFEDSIFEGISFFYPRLSKGGYIFIHDYNSQYLSGVKSAVQRYEKQSGKLLFKVPIADRAGTLVIVK